MSYDYSGYGVTNPETPSEEKLNQNIEVVCSFVVSKLKYPPKKIIIWGFSIGCVPSIDISSRFNFGLLIIQAPIASIHSWINDIFDLSLLKARESRDQFKNYQKIPRVKSDILLIHSIDDEVVTINHSIFLEKVHKQFWRNNNSPLKDSLNVKIPKAGPETDHDEIQKAKESLKSIDEPALAGPKISFEQLEQTGHSKMQLRLMDSNDLIIPSIVNYIFLVYSNFKMNQITKREIDYEPTEEDLGVERTQKHFEAFFTSEIYVNVNFEDQKVKSYLKKMKNKKNSIRELEELKKYLKGKETQRKNLRKTRI